MANSGFIFFASILDAIEDLPDVERLTIYDAITKYGIRGEEPILPPVLCGYFRLLKPNIDSSIKRYNAAVANGKQGGRPRKNQTENQSENQNKNQTENQTTNQDKDKDMDMDTDMEKDTDTDKEKETPYGEYGWPKLKDSQYKKLQEDLGQAELDRCIRYVDESAQCTGNKNKWKDWNLVIRKCSRDGWGKKQPADDMSWRVYEEEDDGRKVYYSS